MKASAGKPSWSVAGERWGWIGGERRGWDRRRAAAKAGAAGRRRHGHGCGWCWEEGNKADASGVSETTGGHVTRLRLGCVWTVEMRRTIQIDFGIKCPFLTSVKLIPACDA
jgi:hypothetical protein